MAHLKIVAAAVGAAAGRGGLTGGAIAAAGHECGAGGVEEILQGGHAGGRGGQAGRVAWDHLRGQALDLEGVGVDVPAGGMGWQGRVAGRG